jgi:SAM-dependent methyltransferase
MALSAITRQLLDAAGLTAGQRVLDIGCGGGEVTRAIAERVGLDGEVVGVDINETAVAAAEAATRESGPGNVRYLVRDLKQFDRELAAFDAVVGRRVLMYLADPAAVLARLVALVHPGGVLAFQEHDGATIPRRLGHWPQHEQIHGWLWEMVRREGADPGLALALPGLLTAAGAGIETVWTHGIVSGFEEEFHHPLPRLVEMLVPRLVAQGVTTPEQIDLPTLADRLRRERAANTSCYVSDHAVCVVARRPGSRA